MPKIHPDLAPYAKHVTPGERAGYSANAKKIASLIARIDAAVKERDALLDANLDTLHAITERAAPAPEPVAVAADAD